MTKSEINKIAVHLANAMHSPAPGAFIGTYRNQTWTILDRGRAYSPSYEVLRMDARLLDAKGRPRRWRSLTAACEAIVRMMEDPT